MLKPISKTVLAVLALGSSVGFAQTQLGEYVSLSGFGTLGAATKDKGGADFVRDNSPEGASKNLSWKVDSKIGLQANVNGNDWWSGTVQVLAQQRDKPQLNAAFEWAFIKLKPLDGLNIRLGRTTPAMFMVSDTRNVGYANTMIRPPTEVYSVAVLQRLDGVDASYAFKLGGTTLTVQGFAGESDPYIVPNTYKVKNVRGLNAVWDTDLGSFRVGRVTSDFKLPAAVNPFGVDLTLPYRFTGLGYQLDNGKAVFAAEWVKRELLLSPFEAFDMKGWYVMGGYRFGAFLPYVSVANAKSANPQFNPDNGNQRSYALGVRWDLVTNAALKVQFERVDPKGTRGTSFSPVRPVQFSSVGAPTAYKSNVLSVALDFTF